MLPLPPLPPSSERSPSVEEGEYGGDKGALGTLPGGVARKGIIMSRSSASLTLNGAEDGQMPPTSGAATSGAVSMRLRISAMSMSMPMSMAQARPPLPTMSSMTDSGEEAVS